MSFCWTLVDQTSTAAQADLDHIVEAISLLDQRFADAWGLVGSHGVASTDPQQVVGASIIFYLKSSDPNVPNALGFHDEQGDTPYVEILVDIIKQNGGGWLRSNGSGASVASVVAHEFFETRCDEFCGSWEYIPSRDLFLARETCDPCQAVMLQVQTSDGTTVELSDAVLPRFFDAQAPSDGSVAFDLAGAVTAPFQLLPQGYGIYYDPNASQASRITSVWGDKMPDWIRAMKIANARSRTSRRLKK